MNRLKNWVKNAVFSNPSEWAISLRTYTQLLRRESDKGSRFPVYGEQPVEQGVRLSFDNIHGEIGYYFLTVEG